MAEIGKRPGVDMTPADRQKLETPRGAGINGKPVNASSTQRPDRAGANIFSRIGAEARNWRRERAAKRQERRLTAAAGKLVGQLAGDSLTSGAPSLLAFALKQAERLQPGGGKERLMAASVAEIEKLPDEKWNALRNHDFSESEDYVARLQDWRMKKFEDVDMALKEAFLLTEKNQSIPSMDGPGGRVFGTSGVTTALSALKEAVAHVALHRSESK